MIGSTISHYTILEKLGEGGMGVVYSARDNRLDRIVALKFLPPSVGSSEEEAIRFDQEAKAISSLNDPHVATIHAIEEAAGERFLVLEYLPGGTLKEKLKAQQSSGHQLPVEEVVNYGLQIAEGLAHAHRRGIIHRDIKTDNIMLTEDGHVKITDFGLAKLKGGPHLTRSGSTMGTAAYMSPEQIRGEEIDARSDLFSLGVVLYELATSVLPFRGEHEAALTYTIANEEPMAPRTLRPGLPASLDRLIRRCLEKDRIKRIQSADEIAAELRSMGDRSKPPRLAAGRKKMAWFVAGAALVVAAIAFVLFLPSRSVRTDRKSIAVLPFSNPGGNREDEYFSDGVTEDVITQLCKVGDLKVISPASVMQYKGVNRSTRDIARELNVATILEGSIRRSEARVHVTAHLIDANTNEYLWAETYDEEMAQIFTIQSDVAQKIASALKATLSDAEKERIRKKPTESLDAYAKYLEGREYYMRYHKEDNENAIRLFRAALSSDPNYALAYAGLGDAYGQRVQKFGFPFSWIDSAISMSYHAISLDPALADGYKALALGFGEKGWYHKALEMNRKAVEVNPNYYPAIQNLGWTNLLMGRLDEALPWMNKSIALSPTFAYSNFACGMAYLSLDDSARAREWLERALEIQPDFTYAHLGLALISLYRRDYATAMQQTRIILTQSPDDLIALNLAGDISLVSGADDDARRFFSQAMTVAPAGEVFFLFRRHGTRLGYLLHEESRRAEADKLLADSRARDHDELEHGNESHLASYDMACIDAIEGKNDEACTWLQKAIDAGWRDYRFGAIDPLLAGLQKESRFKNMLEQVRAKVEAMRKEAEEAER